MKGSVSSPSADAQVPPNPSPGPAPRRGESLHGGFATGRSHMGWGHHQVASPEATSAGSIPACCPSLDHSRAAPAGTDNNVGRGQRSRAQRSRHYTLTSCPMEQRFPGSQDQHSPTPTGSRARLCGPRGAHTPSMRRLWGCAMDQSCVRLLGTGAEHTGVAASWNSKGRGVRRSRVSLKVSVLHPPEVQHPMGDPCPAAASCDARSTEQRLLRGFRISHSSRTGGPAPPFPVLREHEGSPPPKRCAHGRSLPRAPPPRSRWNFPLSAAARAPAGPAPPRARPPIGHAPTPH
ncbi:uncharacterized protein ACIB01_016506 [Guaruba guarouba]